MNPKTAVAYLIILILSACVPVATPVPITPAPLPTAAPTSLPTAAPTVTSTRVPPTATSIPTATMEVKVSDLPQTKVAVSEFASAMKVGGVSVTVDQVLKGLTTKKVTGKDGNQVEIALAAVDPDPQKKGEALEGNYPLMLKTEKGWEKATLQNIARIRGMEFGALLNFNKDFHQITLDNFKAGNAFITWELVEAKKGAWDFSDPDYSINLAASNGFNVMANLIWGKNIAEWAKQDPDLRKVMVDYITQVMTHYKGKVTAWNVYNEANRFVGDVFWTKLGMQGIRDAYKTARAVDPKAKLLYCDFFNVMKEEDIGHLPPIIDTVVSQLKQDGTIDGISMQITAPTKNLDLGKIKTELEKLKKFNLPVNISEFSIMINGENTSQNLQEQARGGAEVIRVLKACDCVVGVTAFGLEDRLTNNIYKRSDSNAGLWMKMSDGSYVPKPIIYAMMAAFVEEP